MTGAEAGVLALAVAVVLLAAGLAMLEAALGRVSRVAVEQAQRDGLKGADALATVSADPARYVNVLLLLRVLAETVATVLVALVCLRLLDDLPALALAAGVMTLVLYVVVGVMPRTTGRQQAVGVGRRLAPLALLLTRVLGPLPRLLILLGNALTPGKGFRDGPFGSEAELRDLVDLAEERGVVEGGARDMIHSVFELGDTLARAVMVPRTEIVWIEQGKSVRQALTLCLRSGFSRVPVVGDGPDDVLGMAYLKDLAPWLLRQESRGDPERPSRTRVTDVMRPVVFVPDTKPVDQLLTEMQANRVHVVVAVDEYGGTAGLVTIEDVIEEIVGEITDEYDREAPPVEQVDATSWRVSARLPLDDLQELVDLEVGADSDVETVAGLLADRLGRVPIPGAEAEVDGVRLHAESAGGRRNRIGTVVVTRVVDGQADRGADRGADRADDDGEASGAGEPPAASSGGGGADRDVEGRAADELAADAVGADALVTGGAGASGGGRSGGSRRAGRGGDGRQPS